MSTLELMLRRWVPLAVLLAASSLWSESVWAQMQAVKQIHTSAGTYQLVFCRHACTLADSNTAIAVGYLVLSSTPIKLTKLPKKEREYFGKLYNSIGRRA
jgi:hypothetical protein